MFHIETLKHIYPETDNIYFHYSIIYFVINFNIYLFIYSFLVLHRSLEYFAYTTVASITVGGSRIVA